MDCNAVAYKGMGGGGKGKDNIDSMKNNKNQKFSRAHRLDCNLDDCWERVEESPYSRHPGSPRIKHMEDTLKPSGNFSAQP